MLKIHKGAQVCRDSARNQARCHCLQQFVGWMRSEGTSHALRAGDGPPGSAGGFGPWHAMVKTFRIHRIYHGSDSNGMGHGAWDGRKATRHPRV